MSAQYIDRKAMKAESKRILADAQVSPKAFTALYLLLVLGLDFLQTSIPGNGIMNLFISVLSSLLTLTLSSGFVLYFLAIRRGERAEFLTLFDGFSFVGKIIALHLVELLFISLWSMLFVIPGIIAAYRYRFALCNLCQNPDLGVMEALDLSKQQTYGYKGQLLMLDLSYLGWGILATLPLELFAMESYTVLFQNFSAGPPAILSTAIPAMGLGVSLLCNLWSIAVQLFYLPVMQCTELGYFEVAQQTSGTARRSYQDPDGLGGF